MNNSNKLIGIYRKYEVIHQPAGFPKIKKDSYFDVKCYKTNSEYGEVLWQYEIDGILHEGLAPLPPQRVFGWHKIKQRK